MLKLWLFDLKKIDSWWKVCMHHQLIAKITEIEKWILRRFISFKGNFKKCNWRLNLNINRWMSVPRKALSGQEWMRYSRFILKIFLISIVIFCKSDTCLLLATETMERIVRIIHQVKIYRTFKVESHLKVSFS